ncbi:hypothetical protein ACFP81_10765 [Deinococcus lacus]|uniref:Uncharacterized protein n=1 Tax=Deinococcus lacus TaxID=392561 RepID=A0ABW1YH30_9DEIO
MDVPPNLQALLIAVMTCLGTWQATKSTERGKARELAKDSQSQFMQTVMAEMDELKAENKELRAGLDAVRDELRQLKAENHALNYQSDEMKRVLNRVAQCPVQNCPCALRAAEFGGTP